MMGGILFVTGAVGLALSGVILTMEARRGKRIGASFRAQCDRYVARTYRLLVFGEIPHTYRTQLAHYMRQGVHAGVRVLMRILRMLERPLARINRRMAHTTRMKKDEERIPSPFLQNIGDGKNGKNPL